MAEFVYCVNLYIELIKGHTILHLVRVVTSKHTWHFLKSIPRGLQKWSLYQTCGILMVCFLWFLHVCLVHCICYCVLHYIDG